MPRARTQVRCRRRKPRRRKPAGHSDFRKRRPLGAAFLYGAAISHAAQCGRSHRLHSSFGCHRRSSGRPLRLGRGGNQTCDCARHRARRAQAQAADGLCCLRHHDGAGSRCHRRLSPDRADGRWAKTRSSRLVPIVRSACRVGVVGTLRLARSQAHAWVMGD